MNDKNPFAHEPTYSIEIDEHGKFIFCFGCSLKSYNENDIKEKYCGKCHIFHKCGLDFSDKIYLDENGHTKKFKEGTVIL